MMWPAISAALVAYAVWIIYSYDDDQWDALYRRMHNNKGDKT